MSVSKNGFEILTAFATVQISLELRGLLPYSAGEKVGVNRSFRVKYLKFVREGEGKK